MSGHPDVLVLRALGLGDTLAAVPALKALRAATSGTVTLGGPPEPGALLRRAGLVDTVAPSHGLDRAGLPRGARVGLNLHGSGPQSHRLLQQHHPERLVAFACPEAGVEGPRWDDDEPERARWCRLVGEAWEVPTDPDDVLLADADGPREDVVVVHPGAASGSRRWPVERWAEVVRRLGRPVVVTGSRAEIALADRLASLAGLDGEVVRAGCTGVEALADLVASARLVLSGDTGIAHLAYAYGTPTVTLFGPVDPRLWGPPAKGPHVALWHGDGTGDPHASEPDPALLRIDVDEVVAAATPLL